MSNSRCPGGSNHDGLVVAALHFWYQKTPVGTSNSVQLEQTWDRHPAVPVPCMRPVTPYWCNAALPKSHIGKKIPSASSSTMAPRNVINRGSIWLDRVFSS